MPGVWVLYVWFTLHVMAIRVYQRISEQGRFIAQPLCARYSPFISLMVVNVTLQEIFWCINESEVKVTPLGCFDIVCKLFRVILVHRSC